MKINYIAAITLILWIGLLGGPVTAQESCQIDCRLGQSTVKGHNVNCSNVRVAAETRVDVSERSVKPAPVLARSVTSVQMLFYQVPEHLPDIVRKLIDRIAGELGMNPRLVRAVAAAESGGDHRAVSRAGAIGVMQLMPDTARAIGVNPWVLEENIRGGCLYLKQLLERYQGNIPLALAAYNAGPGTVDRYNGIPPYRETKQYVARVLGAIGRN